MVQEWGGVENVDAARVSGVLGDQARKIRVTWCTRIMLWSDFRPVLPKNANTPVIVARSINLLPIYVNLKVHQQEAYFC